MAEGVNVRITGKLRRFIEEQTSPNGLYESASEYVRDLIRRDYQRQEERKWSWLTNQLRPGMEAAESEFVPLDPEEIIKVEHEDVKGIFFLRYEHHYVFFRELSKNVLGVVNVLHESMDIPNRLKEDLFE